MTTANLSFEINALTAYAQSLTFMVEAGQFTKQEAQAYYSAELSKLGLDEETAFPLGTL